MVALDVEKSLKMHFKATPEAADDQFITTTANVTKTDELPENFRRGGGSFSIKKFILQTLDLYTGLSSDVKSQCVSY